MKGNHSSSGKRFAGSEYKLSGRVTKATHGYGQVRTQPAAKLRDGRKPTRIGGGP